MTETPSEAQDAQSDDVQPDIVLPPPPPPAPKPDPWDE